MKSVAVVLSALMLVACGGGGGGNSPSVAVVPPVPAPAQLSALNAWKSLMTVGGTWSTAGKSSDGSNYEITTAIAPAIAATISDSRDFKGLLIDTSVLPKKPYNLVTITTTTRRAGTLAGSDTRLLYLDLSDFGLHYLVDPAASSCIPNESSGLVPVATGLNTSGFLFTGVDNVYSKSICYANQFFRATRYRLTWSYEADANLPLFCLNVSSTQSSATSDQLSCFETTAIGVIGTKARISVTAGAFSLISKNY
jgi:hypothetical protein